MHTTNAVSTRRLVVYLTTMITRLPQVTLVEYSAPSATRVHQLVMPMAQDRSESAATNCSSCDAVFTLRAKAIKCVANDLEYSESDRRNCKTCDGQARSRRPQPDRRIGNTLKPKRNERVDMSTRDELKEQVRRLTEGDE